MIVAGCYALVTSTDGVAGGPAELPIEAAVYLLSSLPTCRPVQCKEVKSEVRRGRQWV